MQRVGCVRLDLLTMASRSFEFLGLGPAIKRSQFHIASMMP